MAETVFSVLRKKIDTEVGPIKQALYSRGAATHADYVGMCEKIAGLELAKQMITDLEDKQLHE